MTGEITLRGDVLPIGGVKQKALAAYRAGIRKVIIPKRNLSDLEEVPPEIMAKVEFIPVEKVREVLWHALGIKMSSPRGKRKIARLVSGISSKKAIPRPKSKKGKK